MNNVSTFWVLWQVFFPKNPSNLLIGFQNNLSTHCRCFNKWIINIFIRLQPMAILALFICCYNIFIFATNLRNETNAIQRQNWRTSWKCLHFYQTKLTLTFNTFSKGGSIFSFIAGTHSTKWFRKSMRLYDESLQNGIEMSSGPIHWPEIF